MTVTDVKIRKINTDGKMRAIVSVTFDGELVIHEIKVIDADGKLFVAMPNRKDDKGEFKDIAHPINSVMREKLSAAVLTEYKKETEKETDRI